MVLDRFVESQVPQKGIFEVSIIPRKMAPNTSNVQAILAQIQTAGAAHAEQKPGAREHLLSLSSELTAALELPSETIQRIGWAEVSTSLCSVNSSRDGTIELANK